jgi:hypothetical protein
LAHHENEITSLQEAVVKVGDGAKKREAFLAQRAQQATQAYVSLRKRRDYEIEGFTSEIIALRREIKKMEKMVLRFGPLEDRELALLGLVQETGRKADGIGRDLRGVKSRLYGVEDKLIGLEV